MSLRSALGLFSAIAPNDHQQQEETDAVHPNGSQSFCHQRHPARHVLANPTLSGHQNQDCPTLSDDQWVCASLLSSNVITKQKSLPQALSSMCHPFSQVLMLAIVLNWGQHFEEILVFVTLSGLVVTVQQNSQEITMNLRHYVHNALCCRSKKGSYITCDFFTTCSWELSEEGGWGPSFLIFISFVCWKQTQRQGKTQKLFTCDHRVGVTIVSILKLPCFLLRWPLT